MTRINIALYNGENIDAFEVDDGSFNKGNFKCPECKVKVQYNGGIDLTDPHFKNWPKIEHLSNCEILRINNQTLNGNDKIQSLISTILPRAEKLKKLESVHEIRKARKRYFGKRSRKFLNSLVSITREELDSLEVRTEDKRTVRIKDLILRQDDIITKLNSSNEDFVCILKGYTTNFIEVGNNVKIPMTSGGKKYGNNKKFDLFIPASYKERNLSKLDSITKKLIYCYGIPEKNEYGYKIDLYSIAHQIVIIEL